MLSIREASGQRIRALREKQGWTQEQLAERAELHPNYIGQIERGLKNVSLENIQKIAAGLRIELSDLFDFEYPDPLRQLQQLTQLLKDCPEEELAFILKHIEHLLQWRKHTDT
ncbi:helix-turn-helix domain-containing protein [Ferviditalea candida]|uniref:Helix-turn-helix transcriptional regulator n=1 Tax=Ferviditalea candida TaxID=3108399 RepID=A0ABU5ZK14_9BACL|nr:helix-turn-helix transcriptional regulator [Paenibacillaceae bacterium T2]